MKKTLSVLLALIMLMSCCITAFAYTPDSTYKECTCENCKYKDCNDASCAHAHDCNCCLYCDHLDENLIIKQCVKYEKVDGKRHILEKCCANCTGLVGCDCGSSSLCGCAVCNGSDIKVDDGKGEPILTPEQQEQVETGFQNVIKILAEAFNKFFDAVFKFLRIDEILGKK